MARHLALLVNPAAGRGRARRTAALALPRLREAGCTVQVLEGRDAENALGLARGAVAAGVETLVACGGDGLVHLAVQALAGTSTRLAVLPAGSGNDVARYAGVPRRDPQRAADIAAAGRTRTVDLARAGATWFLTVLAAGFDARVSERAHQMLRPGGRMRYHLATLAELRHLGPLSYILDLDGVPLRRDAVLVAVGNGPSFGGGLRITHGALLDDGLLDVVVVHPLSRRRLLATYPRLLDGSHTGIAEYEHHRARRVTVAADGVVGYADGERVGPLPLTVEVVPRALRLVTAA